MFECHAGLLLLVQEQLQKPCSWPTPRAGITVIAAAVAIELLLVLSFFLAS
jgi:hypothetical protein